MSLLPRIEEAVSKGLLRPQAAQNLSAWIKAGFLPPWALSSLEELCTDGHWEELNDRFFRYLAFGTGGMRDRTIGRVSAPSERGSAAPGAAPEHAAVGTAVLNDFNVIRATLGLYRYCARYLHQKHGYALPPTLVIAHDIRHFSRHFCELSASTWARLGGRALIFDGPRSTPQLSFTVRATGATAGVVITASHNPPHDNGFKAYFDDGAQVVSPHAEGIIHEVYAVRLQELMPFLEKDLSRVLTLPASLDDAYQEALNENLLDPAALPGAGLKAVFTPIHGVGALAAVPLLRRHQVEVMEVEPQWRMDPQFPTVKSPNPENAEALALALARADETASDLVIATDPDGDRVGIAARDSEGSLKLLTGNQTGAVLMEYRLRTLKAQGVIPRHGTLRAAVIKTFVTSPLQDAIGHGHGVKVINTLTGFKYIGEKLRLYEESLQDALRETEGFAIHYDSSAPAKRRDWLLQLSTHMVFGTEESYGYLASDRVRDKDGNAAALQVCELAAALKRKGRTIVDFLDEIYLQYGYFEESVLNLYYEGASGAEKIARILASYRSHPPTQWGEYTIERVRDFGRDDIFDADDQLVPKQDFFIFELDNGYSCAVRGSGTEPKIKYYLYGRDPVPEPSALPEARARVARTLSEISARVEADARGRAET